MTRFRLSTLMLLIVIASLCVALFVQDRRAARREQELRLHMELIVQRQAYSRYLRAVSSSPTVPAWGVDKKTEAKTPDRK
jgi:hypothetical protein